MEVLKIKKLSVKQTRKKKYFTFRSGLIITLLNDNNCNLVG